MSLRPAVVAAVPDGPPYPRLANFYLQGSVIPTNIPALAKWDVLVLNSVWTSEELQTLKSHNPHLKVFFYVCPYCVNDPPNAGDDWQVANFNYASSNGLWWYNWNRTIAQDWPGTRMVNITDYGPVGSLGTWRQYMIDRVEWLVRRHPELDGVFYDNFWKRISWQQGGAIQVDSDCNLTHNIVGCNGVMDSGALVDTLWNRALRDVARQTRQKFDMIRPGQLGVITNSSTDYFSWLNGSMHEYFPMGNNPDPGNPHGYNWHTAMFEQPGGYLVAPFNPNPWNVNILNADWDGTWAAPNRSAEYERHKRFTLASALMGDGYYSLDAAETGHGSIWWEPEYDHAGQGKGYLGYPTGPMRRIGVPSGPELVVNGSFTTGSTPWQNQRVSCNATYTLDNSIVHTGPSSAKLSVTSLSSGGYFKLYQSVPVIGNRGYTLSFWARTTTPQMLLLHLYSGSCPNYRCLTDQYLPLTSTWTRFEIPFVSTGSANAGLDFLLQQVGTVWLDDVSLREGDTSVYRRDFDKGSVLLNYTTAQQNVVLGGTYYRLNIPGSPVFNGAAVSVETVPPSDGRILLRSPQATPAPPPPETRGQLFQNEPNPFNPATRIRFTLKRDEHVTLAIYDIAGRIVKTLVNRQMAGNVPQDIAWNGKSRYGVQARSGIYIYKITTPSFTETRKMTLLQ